MDNPSHIPPVQPLLNPRQDNGRALVMVLSVIAFLAALSLLFTLSAERLKRSWQSQLTQSATVQLMIETDAARDSKIESALSILRAKLPEAQIVQIEKQQSDALLKPWLGNVALPENLPLPVLISIDLYKDQSLDKKALEGALRADGIIAQLDDHSRWSNQLSRTGQSVKAIAMAVLTLILLAAIAITTFATQASLASQRDVLRVLVQVGAQDSFIARLFVSQAAQRGFYGALIGAFCALLVAIFFMLRRRAEDALLPDLSLAWGDGFWLLVFVAGFTLFCALAAYVTATHILQLERRRR